MLAEENTPDYLPARMLNEFVYCPRLFYYEHVEGLFADNQETVEGALRHEKLDRKADALPPANEEAEKIHSRSITLSSEWLGLIAKLDLVEGDTQQVVPVDYKRGSPRILDDGTLQAWDSDQVQLAAQAIVLQENGYSCQEAVAYYLTTKQRVRIIVDDALIQFALHSLQQAKALVAAPQIPPPLEDSPKCPRCSLVGICLPDETRLLRQESHSPPNIPLPEVSPANTPVRRLVPPRDDLRPLYLNTQGMRVGKSGAVLKIQEKNTTQEVRIQEICQLNMFGNIQFTTQAIQTLCEYEIPIAYFSQGGWFYGLTCGLGLKN